MEIIEQKGKPCCINMISPEDREFMHGIAKAAKKVERGKQREELKAKLEAMGEAPEEEIAEVQEQLKGLESDEEVDEVTQLIKKEEEENAQRAKEEEAAAKQKAAEEEAKRIKEAKNAAKLEKLREQERDLLDQRSQPIRQYLMDNVVPYLTEGLIELCKNIPDDPVNSLSDFLLQKADEIDKKN